MTALLALLLTLSAPVADASHAGPMTADETKAFMKQLLRYVEQHHEKTDPKSPQRGMVYEYYDTKDKRWVQGEGLDTMHDGAWLCTRWPPRGR